MRWSAPLIALSLMACSDGVDSTGAGGNSGIGGETVGTCAPGEAPIDGGCRAAGLPPAGPCSPGETVVGDGCVPAGVTECAAGFEGAGCDPILPAEPCAPGTMALLGERACRPVAACGSGTWGDIVVASSTQYVDQSHNGKSDGSAQRPWTQIQSAIDAAAPGATIAIAAGIYAEWLVIVGKPVVLWGRCPELVSIASPSVATIGIGVDGTVVRSVAVTGPEQGILVVGAKDVLIDKVWSHDNGFRGLEINDTAGPAASVIVRDSLFENTHVQAAFVMGSELAVEKSVLRDVPAESGAGPGIYVSDVSSTLTLDGSIVERMTAYGVLVSGGRAAVHGSLLRDTTTGGVPGQGIRLETEEGTGAILEVRSSVLSGHRLAAIDMLGSDATIEESVLAATLPETSGVGLGVVVQNDLGVRRGNLTLRSSLLRDHHAASAIVLGSDATIEATVMRDTAPLDAVETSVGAGLLVHADVEDAERASATVVDSVFDGNSELGIFVVGSDAQLENTAVVNTRPRPSDQLYGMGVLAVPEVTLGERSQIVAHDLLVENNHDVGLVIGGSDAMVEASVVRDTQPRAADLSLGDGINVAPLSGFDASMVLRSSLIERNHRIGVMVAGAHLDMEATLVRDTLPQASDGAFGVGVQVQPTFDSVQPSSLDMRWSRIERSQDTALAIFGSTATVDGTAIVSTAGNPLTGLFGDGIAVSADAESCFDTMCSASAIVTDSLVEQSQRVGVAAFGAEVSLNHMTLACNTIQLNGERDFLIRDDGGNVCTCDGVVTECKVLSAGLTPPPPLDRSGL